MGAGVCETDGQLSPVTAQLYATASVWANHNGPEEANGNEACLLLANQERGVAESNSSGGKTRSPHRSYLTIVYQLQLWCVTLASSELGFHHILKFRS